MFINTVLNKRNKPIYCLLTICICIPLYQQILTAGPQTLKNPILCLCATVITIFASFMGFNIAGLNILKNFTVPHKPQKVSHSFQIYLESLN